MGCVAAAAPGCEDWSRRGTTSHWGFMIRSLENSNQDWLLLSFHWLDNNCPITGWQPWAGSLCLMCPLSSLLYWSVSVGQWGLRRDDTSMQLLLGEHGHRRRIISVQHGREESPTILILIHHITEHHKASHCFIIRLHLRIPNYLFNPGSNEPFHYIDIDI